MTAINVITDVLVAVMLVVLALWFKWVMKEKV